MGGSGSGRYGGRPTGEATNSLILDIALLRRAGLRAGIVATISMNWTCSWDGELPVELRIDARNSEAASIEVRHVTRDSERREISYTVRLTTTRPPFGGLRWWFLCPSRGQRCAKLFLPNGGRYFLSRAGYGLGYACQRGTKADRLQRKARKLNRALGGDGKYGSPTPPKPKGMHWRTYERKVAQLEAIEAAADQAWLREIPTRLLREILA